ncbi:MAG: efflux RND transporter permease subunit [Acidobacteriota bacterium]
MDLTRTALKNTAGVGVAAAIVVFFGLYSLSRLPIQLFPEIERPQMSISTSWRAASPLEVEAEIVEPQEEVLQGLPGLERMTATARPGSAAIELTFALGTDMTERLIDVLGRLNRIPPLPRDAVPPSIPLGGDQSDAGSLIWFFIQVLPGTDRPVADFRQLIEDSVKPRFEGISGVSDVQLFAGAPEEVQIVFDPARAAEFGVDIPSIAARAGTADDVSAGFVEVGRRQYTLRFEGRYPPADLGDMILDWRDGRPVRLGDVATVQVAPGDDDTYALQNGNPAVALRLGRETDANVLASLVEARAIAQELRDGVLAEHGLDIQPSFDPSVFIKRAISLVTSNLALGILFSIGVLWWFLRRARATLLVAMAIPLSLCGTFAVLKLADRSLNVISLAGLAFAVGMVLDAAIVVLENIVRHRERGFDAEESAERGARQVWGALLASTATTVAIFLPVMYLEDVEGQLFADLALTIAIAVVFSLVTAMTVLPAAARVFIRGRQVEDPNRRLWRRLSRAIIALTDSPVRRLAWIVGLLALPAAATLLLMPPLDYLPPVQRDAVDAFLQFPPGSSPETVKGEVVTQIVDRLAPYMAGEQEPALRNYFLWAGAWGGFLGVRAQDQRQVDELLDLVRTSITTELPDTQAFVIRGNLFGNYNGNRSIDVVLQSRDHDALLDAAAFGAERLRLALPEATVRPSPALELSQPELRLVPKDERLREVGWDRQTVGRVVRALGDGLWLGEHFDGDKRLDIILRGDLWDTPEALLQTPLATPAGVVPLGDLVTLKRTVGPNELFRYDRRRSVTLAVAPPDGMSLEQALDAVKTVEGELSEALPADGTLRYGGSADTLRRAVANLAENFLVALGVLFLLMAALFKSLRDAALVVLALPLATVGGVVALRVINWVTFQPLDLLTMIGFIILLGLVVNNAILLVHQTRAAEREGKGRRAAVQEALSLRLRPIFTSTLTSIFGMLPLVANPGPGSAIYRGLAVAIVGGMMVSTLFTLILLPAFLRLGEDRHPEAQLPPDVVPIDRAA